MSSKAFYKSGVPPRLVHRIVSPSFAIGSTSQRRLRGRSPAGTPPWQPERTAVRRSVEVWTTPCIVTCFGKATAGETAAAEAAADGTLAVTADAGVASSFVLINPGNPDLSGTRNFPYFPRGGPVPTQFLSSSSPFRGGTSPSSSTSSTISSLSLGNTHRDWQPLGYVSNWGGMEVGRGMMFPASVVDGLVHLYGGWTLRSEIEALRAVQRLRSWTRVGGPKHESVLCPIGTAVATSSGRGSTLSKRYDTIVHACPPFYRYGDDPQEKLASCYRSALVLALRWGDGGVGSAVRAATPLLGAGARGFPTDVAMKVASRVAVEWLRGASEGHERANGCEQQLDDSISSSEYAFEEDAKESFGYHTLAFALLEDALAENLASHLDSELERSGSPS